VQSKSAGDSADFYLFKVPAFSCGLSSESTHSGFNIYHIVVSSATKLQNNLLNTKPQSERKAHEDKK